MKVKSEREVAQSGPTLSNPMDCSLPGSSIHGIFQARVLEWGAIAFSERFLISHKAWRLIHLDDIRFPRGSTLLQYVDNLLLCSPSQTSSQGDSMHWLKLLTLRKHKVTKEKPYLPKSRIDI